MKRWIVPLTAVSAVVGVVALALLLAGVFDGDEASGTDDGSAEVAGVCAEGHPDCEDTLVDTDVADENDGGGNTIAPVCAPEVPDCEDMIVVGDLEGEIDGDEPPPAEPIVPTEGQCSGDEFADCEDLATAAASSDLQRRLGLDDTDILLEEIAYAEWPDSCLAAAVAGEACDQAITPGFVIVLEAGGEQYEYHTDLNGNVRLAL